MDRIRRSSDTTYAPNAPNTLATKNYTNRNISEKLESVINHKYKVLDHGFIYVIDYMGNDKSIIDAAKASYHNEIKHNSTDKEFIDYLLSHGYTIPFEMCDIKLHIKLPIFIAVEWQKYSGETGGGGGGRGGGGGGWSRDMVFNEFSSDNKEFYLPNKEIISTYHLKDKILQKESGGEAKGREVREGGSKEAKLIYEILDQNYTTAHDDYLTIMNAENDNDRKGTSNNFARICLPSSCYTEFYWKINLHKLLDFIKLKDLEDSLYEMKEYIKILSEIVQLWIPQTWKYILDYKSEYITLTQKQLSMLKIKEKANESLTQKELDTLKNIVINS
jgi:thymidylate synthase (FAD)